MCGVFKKSEPLLGIDSNNSPVMESLLNLMFGFMNVSTTHE